MKRGKQGFGFRCSLSNFAERGVSGWVGASRLHSRSFASTKLTRTEISSNLLTEFEESVKKDPKVRLATNAITRMDVLDVIMDRDVMNQVDHLFSHQIKEEGKPVTDQRASGRCWMFAALNTMRIPFAEKYKLDGFEFSQSYLFFYDKLEKANYFLHHVIQTKDEDLKGRRVMWLLSTLLADGGQWDMFVNLVEKYGVVPKSAYPEAAGSSSTKTLNWLIKNKLRECAMKIRTANEKGESQETLIALKNDCMAEVYKILTIFLGTPPKRFDWAFKDKDKKYNSFPGLTPQEFLKTHVPFNVQDYYCLIHSPTEDKPYYKHFTIQMLGNVVGGRKTSYINVPMEEIKSYTLAQMKEGETVWFGCDVGKHFHRSEGILDTKLFDYGLAFDTKFGMDKAQRLNFMESQMTHAMVFTGVDINTEGKPVKWRVENSWGEKSGKKGYIQMSDEWFEEYLYEVLINKKHLSPNILEAASQEPIELPPWDPFGAIAHHV